MYALKHSALCGGCGGDGGPADQPPHADEGEGVGAAPQASYGEGGDAVPPNGVAPNAVYGERGGGGAARHELFAEGEGGEPATNRDRQHSMRSRWSILVGAFVNGQTRSRGGS
tara:strand:+ start:1479 stop:1817 length:339 start_codon:yes stop_codon:yes gene_type:complete